MRLPTASALDRALACPGSTALPQRRHTSSDTEWGTVAHRFLDRAHAVGREKALGEIEDPDQQARCAAIDFVAIPDGASSEVSLAYDIDDDSAERIDLAAPRAYSDDGRIYGTADRVGIRDGRVFVADFKTGAMKVRAHAAMQLRFLALAAARWCGLEEAHVQMLYLGHDGRWYADRADLDALDLDATRAELLAMRAGFTEARRVVAAGGLPQLLPGLHCEHCAAAPECPAQERQQRALVAVAPPDPADLMEWIAGMPELQAGELVERAIVVAKLATRVREAANARVVSSGDLPLPSGRTLRRVRYGAPKMDDEAKERIGGLKEELREQGHITTEQTWQVRVVGGARSGR
jgi:hypothetical protein